jgi:uncharacterized protein involved in exopolysaccharide biosynthesis
LEQCEFAAKDTLKTIREKSRRVMDSPKLPLQQERLVRDVTVKSTIVAELQKRFELAMIEIKNMTIASVLGAPAYPAYERVHNR